jgi:hypothetical protein
MPIRRAAPSPTGLSDHARDLWRSAQLHRRRADENAARIVRTERPLADIARSAGP